MMVKHDTYWKGSKARYTGKKEDLYGGTFYELELLDGHRKGKFVLTSTPPENKDMEFKMNKSKRNPTYGYIGFYKDKRYEVYADTIYEAQQKIAKIAKAKKTWQVNVMLAEKDGMPVVHRAVDNPIWGKDLVILEDDLPKSKAEFLGSRLERCGIPTKLSEKNGAWSVLIPFKAVAKLGMMGTILNPRKRKNPSKKDVAQLGGATVLVIAVGLIAVIGLIQKNQRFMDEQP